MEDSRSSFAAKTLGLMGGVVTSLVMSACYGSPPFTPEPPDDTGDTAATGHTGDTGDTTTGDTAEPEDTGL